MNSIQTIIDGYTAFATDNGTVHDAGSKVMLVAPFVRALLAMYVAWSFAAMTVDGAKRTYRAAGSTARKVAGREPVAAPVA